VTIVPLGGVTWAAGVTYTPFGGVTSWFGVVN